MVNIDKKLQRIKELEAEIQEAKKKVNEDFGEIIIDVLGIDYGLLSNKKEMTNVANEIKKSLSYNPFSKNSHDDTNESINESSSVVNNHDGI